MFSLRVIARQRKNYDGVINESPLREGKRLESRAPEKILQSKRFLGKRKSRRKVKCPHESGGIDTTSCFYDGWGGEICKEQSDGIAKRHVISKMRTSEARAKTLQNRKGRLFFAK